MYGSRTRGLVECNTQQPPRHGEHNLIVHLASGTVELDTVDFRQPGPIPIEFRRLYASYWAHSPTIFGSGWSHAYATALGSDCPGSDACVSLAGLGWSYRFNPVASSYNSQAPPQWEGRTPESPYYRSVLTLDGPRLRLTQANGDTSWFFNCTDIAHPCTWNGFRRSDGASLDFKNDAFHNLISLHSGVSGFALGYDENRRINGVFLDGGDQLQYEHDQQGCLSRVTYADRSAVLYGYQSNGCLLNSVAVQPAAAVAPHPVLAIQWEGKRARKLTFAGGTGFSIDYEDSGGFYVPAFELTTASGHKYRFEVQADRNYVGRRLPGASE
jgi:hypothetical protein